MEKRNLISLFEKRLNGTLKKVSYSNKNLSFSGIGNVASKVFMMSDILREREDALPLVWVVNDYLQQEAVYNSLKLWTPYNVSKYNLKANPNDDYEIRRQNDIKMISFLSSLFSGEEKIFVVTFKDIMVEVPDLDEFEESILTLKKDEKIKIVDLFEDLIDIGYEVSKDSYIEKGNYFRHGGVLDLFPVNMSDKVKIEADFDEIGSILQKDKYKDGEMKSLDEIKVFPLNLELDGKRIFQFLKKNGSVLEDELEISDEEFDEWNDMIKNRAKNVQSIVFTPFSDDSECHVSMQYTSLLKYRGVYDFTNDVMEKKRLGFKTVIFTKDPEEIKNIFDDKNISFVEGIDSVDIKKPQTIILEIGKDEVLPPGFQNAEFKIAIITDKELSGMRTEGKKVKSNQKVFLDFLSSLKMDDLVVHEDYGVAKFLGLEKRTVDGVTREYIKLGYAENDKLFVPIDQADKVNKFVGAEESAPKLTRLGSAEWSTITKRVRKETQKIAKELLELYAKRKSVTGFKYKGDKDLQAKFEETFPYEETPGQIKAIMDTKKDMENEEPMDRLVCGDVGFGKTEVALRAAFKAIQDKKQVALISPITILADQHYRSFTKRMAPFNVRIEMLSRFKSAKEQKEIVKKLEKGEVDIVVGTHRLLQKDIKFKNLGLVVVDEEQRFGVQQKEKLKEMRAEVDILTLTATPIPRTLNICLNKLRDITTITTPPPGRLPIITEVRRFSNELIKEAIKREIERKGQVYFLHNRVQTIEGIAEKLRSLIPEARIVVAHGKLSSKDLEDRIIAFKDHKYDVLVSSTIIENGIDLSNANTLIVNNAEKFGLSQLYQLRGRVGRGKQQAYAYFLYHTQRLKLDAKKRLRAIVEASELGSGFQIAMKDLEIRGAGDILGANQHGVISSVGVSHFIRMLNKAVDDLKTGRVVKEGEDEVPEVSIELPLTAFIPDSYIVNAKDKINAYQKLSAADSHAYLAELKEDIEDDYGKMPKEVSNLFRILDIKLWAKKANLVNVKAENVHMAAKKQIVLTMSSLVKPPNIMSLLNYNMKWIISGNKLKLPLDELGVDWLKGLKDNIKQLTKKVEPGKA